ncbi:MAG: hypothetical protein M1832_005907 [Thelocarpon impressellum]|nr:MAG: hypothetical protein M1832_005907 [Thelocarpon impressellum]
MPAAEASELDLALENAPVGPSANDLSIETEDIPDDSTPEEDPLDVVNQAFKEGIIHPAYCPTMVHVADGKYMVPQKCLRCVETNAFCDRDYPCMRCRADDHGCGGAEGNRIMVEAGRDHAFKFIVGNLEGFHQGLKLRSTGQPGAFCTNPPLPSYQSSAYVKNGLAYALLVDKDCGRRDFMDGNVVITRMGGGRELQLDGTRVQAKGQRGDDSTLRSFVNSMERKSPVVVIVGAHDFPYTGHALPIDWCLPPLKEDIRFDPNYRIHTFTIPGCGTITHFMANQTVNKRAGGPDDMFVSLQKAPLGLKRFALTNANCKGPLLTQHFAMNFGMPYKYVVDVDSKSFGEAPEVVLSALNRLTWAGEQSSTDHDFKYYNELLTLGYFEEQKIGYHDDGESTLGPSIATLSLGGQAAMRIRMKASCWNGPIRKKAYKSTLPVPPGCKNEKELTELNAKFKNATAEQWQSLVETYLNRKKDAKANPPVALELQLNHGDMVVMNGADIQKFYETNEITQAAPVEFPAQQMEVDRPTDAAGLSAVDQPIAIPDAMQVGATTEYDRGKEAAKATRADRSTEPAEAFHVDKQTSTVPHIFIDPQLVLAEPMLVDGPTEVDLPTQVNEQDHVTQPSQVYEPTSAEVDVSSPLSSPPPGFFDNGV